MHRILSNRAHIYSDNASEAAFDNLIPGRGKGRVGSERRNELTRCHFAPSRERVEWGHCRRYLVSHKLVAVLMALLSILSPLCRKPFSGSFYCAFTSLGNVSSDSMEAVGSIFSFDTASLNETAPHVDGCADTIELLEKEVGQIHLDKNDEEGFVTTTSEGAGMTCLACGIGGAGQEGFSSAEEQRIHFKTDWHRCNVKRKLNKLQPLSEADFEAVVMRSNDGANEDWEVGSLSGSETDSVESMDEKLQDDPTETSAVSGPYFTVRSNQDGILAVWKCILGPDRSKKSQPDELSFTDSNCMSTLKTLLSNQSRWAIILSRGGHFAAAIYDIIPPKNSNVNPRPEIQEIVHKSFHKYVVRAKAGGKQSTQDASGKYARSAGSRLRRYNEMSLERDIVSTMGSWKETLASCQLIFIAAPGSNGRLLLSGDTPIFDKADERVRKIPFVTRRPTISETKRVVGILLTLYRPLRVKDDEKQVHGVHSTSQKPKIGAKSTEVRTKPKDASVWPTTSVLVDQHKKMQKDQDQDRLDGEDSKPKSKSKHAMKRAKQKLRNRELHEKNSDDIEQPALSEAAIQEEILKAAAKATQSHAPR